MTDTRVYVTRACGNETERVETVFGVEHAFGDTGPVREISTELESGELGKHRSHGQDMTCHDLACHDLASMP